jgi:hypothetical protein
VLTKKDKRINLITGIETSGEFLWGWLNKAEPLRKSGGIVDLIRNKI